MANSWQRILDLGNSYGGAGYGFQMLTPYGYAGEGLFSQISLYDSGGSGDTNYVTTNVVASTNVEHMYAVTFNESTSPMLMSIYMDGTLIGSTTATVDPSTTIYSDFWIGRSQFAADPYFDGTIDELRIYNNAQSAAQITTDYLAGPTPFPEPAFGCMILLAATSVGHRSRRRNISGTGA